MYYVNIFVDHKLFSRIFKDQQNAEGKLAKNGIAFCVKVFILTIGAVDRCWYSDKSLTSIIEEHVSSICGCHHFWESWPYLISHVTWKQNLLKLRQLTTFLDETKAKGWSAFRCRNWLKDLLKLMLLKNYDVTNTSWRHYFLVNANLKKSLRQFLHLKMHSTLWLWSNWIMM